MSKIFISYKYGDLKVKDLGAEFLNAEGKNTARSFVNYLQRILEDSHHINKGETDDASLADFTDPTIQTKLGDKIFDSSVTIVLISKGMYENGRESEQWIPWEISYSLKDKSRDGGKRTSKTNAMIAIVIPDENEYYDHAVIKKDCGVREWQTSTFFNIISDNMFNNLNPTKKNCDRCGSSHHYNNDHSYIVPVKWDDFIVDPDEYIGRALKLRDRLEDYKITKNIKYQ